MLNPVMCQTLGRLHLAYYTVQILLFRALMAPASEEAKHDPMSSLRRYFEAAVDEATLFSDFVECITEDDIEAFWGRREWQARRLEYVRALGLTVAMCFVMSRCPGPADFGWQFSDLSVLPFVERRRSAGDIRATREVSRIAAPNCSLRERAVQGALPAHHIEDRIFLQSCCPDYERGQSHQCFCLRSHGGCVALIAFWMLCPYLMFCLPRILNKLMILNNPSLFLIDVLIRQTARFQRD